MSDTNASTNGQLTDRPSTSSPTLAAENMQAPPSIGSSITNGVPQQSQSTDQASSIVKESPQQRPNVEQQQGQGSDLASFNAYAADGQQKSLQKLPVTQTPAEPQSLLLPQPQLPAQPQLQGQGVGQANSNPKVDRKNGEDEGVTSDESKESREEDPPPAKKKLPAKAKSHKKSEESETEDIAMKKENEERISDNEDEAAKEEKAKTATYTVYYATFDNSQPIDPSVNISKFALILNNGDCSKIKPETGLLSHKVFVTTPFEDGIDSLALCIILIRGGIINPNEKDFKSIRVGTLLEVPGFTDKEENGLFRLKQRISLLDEVNGKNFFKALEKDDKNFLVIRYNQPAAPPPAAAAVQGPQLQAPAAAAYLPAQVGSGLKFEDYLNKAFGIGYELIKSSILEIVDDIYRKERLADHKGYSPKFVEVFFDEFFKALTEKRKEAYPAPERCMRLRWWEKINFFRDLSQVDNITLYCYKLCVDSIKKDMLARVSDMKGSDNSTADEEAAIRSFCSGIIRKRGIVIKRVPGFRESLTDFCLLQDRRLHTFVGRAKAIKAFAMYYIDVDGQDRLKPYFCSLIASPGLGKTRFLEQVAAIFSQSNLPEDLNEFQKNMSGLFPILISFNTLTRPVSGEEYNIEHYTGLRILLSIMFNPLPDYTSFVRHFGISDPIIVSQLLGGVNECVNPLVCVDEISKVAEVSDPHEEISKYYGDEDTFKVTVKKFNFYKVIKTICSCLTLKGYALFTSLDRLVASDLTRIGSEHPIKWVKLDVPKKEDVLKCARDEIAMLRDNDPYYSRVAQIIMIESYTLRFTGNLYDCGDNFRLVQLLIYGLFNKVLGSRKVMLSDTDEAMLRNASHTVLSPQEARKLVNAYVDDSDYIIESFKTMFYNYNKFSLDAFRPVFLSQIVLLSATPEKMQLTWEQLIALGAIQNTVADDQVSYVTPRIPFILLKQWYRNLGYAPSEVSNLSESFSRINLLETNFGDKAFEQYTLVYMYIMAQIGYTFEEKLCLNNEVQVAQNLAFTSLQLLMVDWKNVKFDRTLDNLNLIVATALSTAQTINSAQTTQTLEKDIQNNYDSSLLKEIAFVHIGGVNKGFDDFIVAKSGGKYHPVFVETKYSMIAPESAFVTGLVVEKIRLIFGMMNEKGGFVANTTKMGLSWEKVYILFVSVMRYPCDLRATLGDDGNTLNVSGTTIEIPQMLPGSRRPQVFLSFCGGGRFGAQGFFGEYFGRRPEFLPLELDDGYKSDLGNYTLMSRSQKEQKRLAITSVFDEIIQKLADRTKELSSNGAKDYKPNLVEAQKNLSKLRETFVNEGQKIVTEFSDDINKINTVESALKKSSTRVTFSANLYAVSRALAFELNELDTVFSQAVNKLYQLINNMISCFNSSNSEVNIKTLRQPSWISEKKKSSKCEDQGIKMIHCEEEEEPCLKEDKDHQEDFSYVIWKLCASDNHRKYSVDRANPRAATKDCKEGYCTIIGNTPLPPNKVTSWCIEVLNTKDNDGDGIFIGVAPSDIDQSNNYNYSKCGWYFYCYESKLFSGPPHNYDGKEYGPRKGEGEYVYAGDSVGVVMDTTKGEISFVVNSVNLGVAYEGIPLDKPLVPCAILAYKGDSVELIP